jgi:ABC-type multidrug transport system ATPase subunit
VSDNRTVMELNKQVVFMDEPSTGLDPSSRNNLWNVVKEAKKNCAIILTSNALFLFTCASTF